MGGKYRGRKLQYGGDRRVRPMKDRVREALFNLIGPLDAGHHALDLFAGTGALGLEAVSRGAVRATFIERHFPTARVLRENIATLGVEALTEVVTADVFVWLRQDPTLPACPWVVFVSPPYDFYVDKKEAMIGLIGGLMENAPVGSVFAVESDGRFDFDLLSLPDRWNIRSYQPAVVGVFHQK
ncbi:MAG: RsmD family RNA methyltransferase [Pirellulales bacterium]|nr:RsmD family RNA methyltransferase [Pirellulales bacterium]